MVRPASANHARHDHLQRTCRRLQQTSGPIVQKKLDLTGILSNIQARQVFFIDEVHRLMPDVEECSTLPSKISVSTS
jgi:hypothetical protein